MSFVMVSSDTFEKGKKRGEKGSGKGKRLISSSDNYQNNKPSL